MFFHLFMTHHRGEFLPLDGLPHKTLISTSLRKQTKNSVYIFFSQETKFKAPRFVKRTCSPWGKISCDNSKIVVYNVDLRVRMCPSACCYFIAQTVPLGNLVSTLLHTITR